MHSSGRERSSKHCKTSTPENLPKKYIGKCYRYIAIWQLLSPIVTQNNFWSVLIYFDINQQQVRLKFGSYKTEAHWKNVALSPSWKINLLAPRWKRLKTNFQKKRYIWSNQKTSSRRRCVQIKRHSKDDLSIHSMDTEWIQLLTLNYHTLRVFRLELPLLFWERKV